MARDFLMVAGHFIRCEIRCVMSKFPFKLPPMPHQLNALKKAYKMPVYGLFHGMGTGKTFTIINLAAARFMDSKIEALIVLCPNPIKLVWEEEISKFCPVPVSVHVIGASKSQTEKFTNTPAKQGHMKALVTSIESLSQGTAIQYVLAFAKKHECMIACDESSRLKNATSNRTKNATKVSRLCKYSIIATGTPITQGIHDLYGQMNFLSPEIIGINSWVTFRNTYCVMGGFEGRLIVGYRNAEELMDKVRPYVDIVRTEDVLDLVDLPPRTLKVPLTREQSSYIDQLGDMFEAQMDDKLLVCRTVLDRLTRFQQIIGGHFPFNDGHDGNGKKVFNYDRLKHGIPKLEALMEDIEDNIPTGEKVVIWARFVPEIVLIREALEARYGKGSVVDFYGKTECLKTSNAEFKGGKAQFMVANPQVGGMGQTWVVARFEYYYSCSFSYEDREQAGRRIKRKGQERATLTTEIIADSKYDRMIFKAIKHKGGLAQFVESVITTGEMPDERLS